MYLPLFSPYRATTTILYYSYYCRVRSRVVHPRLLLHLLWRPLPLPPTDPQPPLLVPTIHEPSFIASAQSPSLKTLRRRHDDTTLQTPQILYTLQLYNTTLQQLYNNSTTQLYTHRPGSCSPYFWIPNGGDTVRGRPRLSRLARLKWPDAIDRSREARL